jgi:hypothetical protein
MRRGKTRTLGDMGSVVLGVVLGVVASLFIARGIWGLRRLSRLSSWPAVDATVIASGLEKFPPIEGGPDSRPMLSYQYTVSGKTYRSSRLGITPDAFDFFSRESENAFVARYPQGSRLEVRVCPTDPSLSVIDEAASPRKRNHFLTLVVSGGVLISCIIMVAYVA